MLLSLSGKVALITGGSRGIGAATVRMFTAAGAKVVFSYQKAQSQADALAKECGESNCRAVASSLDKPNSARALVADAVQHFGRLDILVANHGVWPAQDVAIDKKRSREPDLPPDTSSSSAPQVASAGRRFIAITPPPRAP